MQANDPLPALLESSLAPFIASRGIPYSPALLDQELFGSAGVLDSVDFVSFLVDFEQAIRAKTGKPVVLSDERAFSLEKSPFRTLRTLLAFAKSSLDAAG